MNLTITNTRQFNKSAKLLAKKYTNFKNDLKVLREELLMPSANSTDLGDNFYKIRLQNISINKGKSSGFRVVYFYKTIDNEIYLLDIYSKNDIKTISKNQLLKLVKTYNLQ
jgi:hypothetical protein